MYAPFCKEFQKKKCDSVNQAGNDFYLAHRECDGEPDCDDLTDERSCDGLPDSVFVSGKIWKLFYIKVLYYQSENFWLNQQLKDQLNQVPMENTKEKFRFWARTATQWPILTSILDVTPNLKFIDITERKIQTLQFINDEIMKIFKGVQTKS